MYGKTHMDPGGHHLSAHTAVGQAHHKAVVSKAYKAHAHNMVPMAHEAHEAHGTPAPAFKTA